MVILPPKPGNYGNVKAVSGKVIYQFISKVGGILGMIPKTDQEHKALIARAMFIAANVEVFTPIILGMIAFFVVLYFRRKK